RQIKFLIDGSPIENMFQGGAHLGGAEVPLNGIKRIEVVRGPGSVVYGADAFAGVINLVTDEPGERDNEISVRTGQFNSTDISLYVGKVVNDHKFSLSIEHQESDGDDDLVANADLQTVFDGLFGTSASLAPGKLDESYDTTQIIVKYQWKNLKIQHYNWKNEFGLGAGIANALDSRGYGKSEATNTSIRYAFDDLVPGTMELSGNLRTSDYESQYTIFPGGSVFPVGADGNIFTDPGARAATGFFVLFPDGVRGNPGWDGEAITVKLNHRFNVVENFSLRWEVGREDWSFEGQETKNFGPGVLDIERFPILPATITASNVISVTGTEFVYVPPVERDFNFASISTEWRPIDDILISGGVRYDSYSDFGSTTNPRAGVIWEATDILKLKFFVGTSFRAPAISDLSSQNNPVLIGNPNLEPEEITTAETSFSLDLLEQANLLLSGSIFTYDGENVIQPILDPDSGASVSQNVGEFTAFGYELEAKWKPAKAISIDVNYTNIDAETTNTLADLTFDTPVIAGSMANLMINWRPISMLNLNTTLKWTGDRERAPGDARGDVSDMTIINVKAELRNLVDGLFIGLSVRNLTDEDAEYIDTSGSIPNDISIAGRQAFIEARFEF
ncbi:MAG: TonB-dependent receptor, partial [Gammaproteobacteria bacterium]|nr:TonB-dependent receptor [Gammaproteobacteria bacterium]